MPVVQGRSVIIQGGNFVNVEQAGREDGLGALRPHISPNAFFNARYHEEPARCHPGTREQVLAELGARLEAPGPDHSEFKFIWTHGPAGVGKTAVMRTLCEQLDAKGQLLGSFFFFKSDTTRNSGQPFVPTLAYHLCQAIPELSGPVLETIHKDPAVLTLGLEVQAQKLIIDPILHLAKSREGFPDRPPQAIVVDGLDECDPEYDRAQVIRVLGLLSDAYPSPLFIFVTSRPHFDIRTHFESTPLLETTAQQAIYQDSQADADIRKYLTDKFGEIQHKHRLRKHLPLVHGRWPSLTTIDILVDKASGQFIFAATIVRFVRFGNANPDNRLQILLGYLKPDVDGLRPFEQLDNLYHAIFDSICSSYLQSSLDILALCIVYPLSILRRPPNSIAITKPRLERQVWNDTTVVTLEPLGLLLSDRRSYCQELMADLEALVETVPSPDVPGHHILRSFHKSLTDFLTSYSRAGPALFISPERPWECLSVARFRCNFWYEDVYAMSILLQMPNPVGEHHDASGLPLDMYKRQPTSQFFNFMNSPEITNYDYRAAAARIPRHEDSKHLWNWMDCVARFLETLESSTFKELRALHRRSFGRYLQSGIDVYAAHPGLWVLLGLSVGRREPSSSHNTNAAREGRSNLAEKLRCALKPELLLLEIEQGFGVTHGIRPNSILDPLSGSFMTRNSTYACAAQAIRTLAFGNQPNEAYWHFMIDDFARKAVERGEVPPSVAQSVLSDESFLYAAGHSVDVGFGIWSMDTENLRNFLETFPNHLNRKQRDLVQRMIDSAVLSSTGPPSLLHNTDQDDASRDVPNTAAEQEPTQCEVNDDDQSDAPSQPRKEGRGFLASIRNIFQKRRKL